MTQSIVIPPFLTPTPKSVGRSEEGPGYPRHRDYSSIHHGGTDGLICVELGYPHMHFDRWPGQTTGRKVEAVVTPNDGGLGPVTHTFPPSHQGGRGAIKRINHHRVNHPPKEVGDAKTEDSHWLCPLVAVCRGRVFDRLHSASVAIKPSQPRKTPNLHGATEPSTFGNWMINVRANRARRKTAFVKITNVVAPMPLTACSPCLLTIRKLLPKYTSIQTVHTLQPISADIEYCCLEVTRIGLTSCIRHASATLSKAFLREGSRQWNRMQKMSLWPRPLRGLPGLPCHVRKELSRVVATVMPLLLSG